jgi:hypothetical protein
MSSDLNAGLKEVVSAIKSTQGAPSGANPSTLSSFNWSPIVQGLVTGVASSLGLQVVGQTTNMAQTPVVPENAPVSLSSSVNLNPIETRINNLESKLGSLDKLSDRTKLQLGFLDLPFFKSM